MNDKKRRALEAAGYRVGDVSDFLGLSEEERALAELRAAVSSAVHEQRKKRNLTQAELADLLHSSQSRVAKIEAGSSDVSLDLMFRGLFAAGGRVTDVVKRHAGGRPRRGRPPAKKKPAASAGR
ncbi:MAG: XRE family transcriptional regulator [Zavarzinella sp.]|nr:XRE family transcriptional regulator [Zavarzinella sp.]